MSLVQVGFGDIVPITPGGRLVVCASILVGVAVIPAQAASLIEAILESQNDEKTEADATASSASRREAGALLATAAQVSDVDALEVVDSVPVQEEGSRETSENYCPDCEQTEHREDALFCWSCGSRILRAK